MVGNGLHWMPGAIAALVLVCAPVAATPWARRKVYSGPCRSGWVYRKFVTDYAG